ncbi:MAG: BrnA antitoxin family protein [Candidatus Marinimicrobia bacterium]|nr:BrnA antitoxin family protein [Candidatus Neomarinimicrobiota bacterium]
MKNKLKEIPKFESEEQEREFWANADSSEYLDWRKSKPVNFPNLKPSVKPISIRLPEAMLEELRTIANKQDVPYQSLIKIYLRDAINRERQAGRIKSQKRREKQDVSKIQ